MKNLFDKIKDSELYRITYFAKMENNKFKDFEYFMLEKCGVFFYIQKAPFGGFEVTTFKKINYNEKQQLFFPVRFYCFEELTNIIDQHIKDSKKYSPLKGTHIQTIYHELKTFVNYNGKYQTLEKHIKDLAGSRELQILEHLDYVEMKQNDSNYLVLEFYSKTGQAFAINTKNINRLFIS